MMDEFDERQVSIRGNIAIQTVAMVLVLLVTAAFLNDFEIVNLEREVGFSPFLLGLASLITAFVSCSLILRNAYFGLISLAKSNRCIAVFTILAVLQTGLLLSDLLRGEGITFVSICITLMVVSITTSFWYKRKDS